MMLLLFKIILITLSNLLTNCFSFFFSLHCVLFDCFSLFSSSRSQLLLPRNGSVSFAVKVKTRSSPHLPPPPLPPVPPCLLREDCDSGLPQTSQLTPSLTSHCHPSGDSKILFVVTFLITRIIIITTTTTTPPPLPPTDCSTLIYETLTETCKYTL